MLYQSLSGDRTGSDVLYFSATIPYQTKKSMQISKPLNRKIAKEVLVLIKIKPNHENTEICHIYFQQCMKLLYLYGKMSVLECNR